MKVDDVKASWPSSSITAVECGLWYCVNEYDSSVKGGNLFEDITTVSSSRAPNSRQVSSQQDPITELKTTPPDSLSYDVLSASVTRTDLQIDGTGFNISQASVYSISDFMSSTFTTTAQDFGNDPNGPLSNNAYVIDLGNAVYGPTVMQMLYQSQDLNATFAALAKSMTNSIRENSDGGLVAYGKAGTNYTLIQVHWHFLILPAALIVAGAAFLAIIVYHTRASGIAVWNSNMLPAVALGKSTGAIFDKIELLSQMEDIGESHLVRYPQSHYKKPDLDASARSMRGNRGGEYEMVSPEDGHQNHANVGDAISEFSYHGLDIGEGTQSQDHLV